MQARAGEALHRRTRVVGFQRQSRQVGQGFLPVGQLVIEQLFFDQLVPPCGEIRVLRSRCWRHWFVLQIGIVCGEQFLGKETDRPAIGGDMVHQDQYIRLIGFGANHGHAHRPFAIECKRDARRLCQLS